MSHCTEEEEKEAYSYSKYQKVGFSSKAHGQAFKTVKNKHEEQRQVDEQAGPYHESTNKPKGDHSASLCQETRPLQDNAGLLSSRISHHFSLVFPGTVFMKDSSVAFT